MKKGLYMLAGRESQTWPRSDMKKKTNREREREKERERERE